MDWRNNWKMQAENCYAQAVVCLGRAELDQAKHYGEKAIELYERVRIETLQDAAPTRMQIFGIYLPDIMHEDVVKKKLGL